MSALKVKNRTLAMVALVISGEAIFFLPFVLPRVFRPTMLDVFGITNFELGSMFSAYGIVAMASYFLGGPIADRYPARNLMTGALVATAIGGVGLALIPSKVVITMIYAFWGLTTILLFWAALIRATREWGSVNEQGKAFGYLEGGRGLSAALIATAGISMMSYLLPIDVNSASMGHRIDSFQFVLLMFSGATLLVAGLVWYALPGGKVEGEHTFLKDLSGIKSLLAKRTIWLQAIIIVCGYVGYKITDDFPLYAQDVLGFDEVRSAGVGTLGLWIRPIICIAAGLLADRYMSSKILIYSFAFMVLGSLMASLDIFDPGILLPYFITLLSVGIGVYAVRTLYYAIMEEAKIPIALTGTAVGIASVVGYTPDIFIGPLMGWLLDRSPGADGHQHLFLVMTGFAIIGLIASIAFRYRVTKKDRN